MKKNSNFFQKALLMIALIFFSYVNSIAQSNAISISINGIEYDDPGFSLLKESLQKNKNVTSVKPAYEQGTAKLNFNYNRNAQNLWDELPQTTKQFFKITTINDNNIVLESKSAVKQTTVIKTNTTTTKADDDCKNCYFNICNYDGTKSFQGKIFRQINKDNGTYYYNCDNGVLVEKIIYTNSHGQTTNITNDTIIMSNAPIGTTWGLVDENSTFLGIKRIDYHKYTLVKKHITLTVNGKTYDDVLVVNYYSKSYSSILGGDNLYSLNRYYVKGVGLIKEETLDPNVDPLAHISNQPVSIANIPEMKGVIDPLLVGTWTDKDPSGFSYTYKFYADGTYEYYVGTTLSYVGSKCFWRLDGKYLNLYCTGWAKVYKQEFQKKNDNATGKPEVVIQFKDTEYRTYLSEDNKASWK